MKKIYKIQAISLLAISLFLTGASFSNAEEHSEVNSVRVQSSGSLEVKAVPTLYMENEMEMEKEMEREMEGESEMSDDSEGDPDRPVIMNSQMEVEREMKESGEKGGTADINIGVGELDEDSNDNMIRVRAVEIRGWDSEEKEAFLGTVKTHVELKSDQDLENFAKGILLKDENVEEVSLNYGEVKTKYKVKAKFLGIFNTEIKQESVVTFGDGENGRVKVKFPWYGFLFSKSVGTAEVETEIESELSNIDDQDEISRAARVLLAISNIMKAKHDSTE